MKNILKAFRSLFKKGRGNGIKILSLGVGLAMGLVLISKVVFEYTYDDFYPDADRIYQIHTSYSTDDDPEDSFSQISGAVAPTMMNEVPEVEVATRFTYFGNMVFKTPDEQKYKGLFIMADTCFFDVLPLPVLAGDIKDVLSRPLYCMVSEKIANNMGGIESALGKIFELDAAPGRPITIGGVFKDVPENSHFHYDVIVSLITIGRFSWDGTENWLGNERYIGYVKLYSGVEPESLYPAFRQMLERHVNMEDLQKSGLELWHTLMPLRSLHSDLPETKRMSVLLGLLAFALLFTAVMNYFLIVLSSLVARTKEMAVYKSYGASGKNIMNIMLSETAVHLLLALILSFFLILIFRSKIHELLTVSIGALFTGRTIVLLIVVCLLVFLVAGIIPSWLYARIPVASAFRSFKESRRNWKLASLFIQFIATMFLVSLLVIIWRQYKLMINDNPGYAYENLLYSHTGGVSPEERQRAIDELNKLPIVKQISTAYTLPIQGMSGNNVSFPGDDKDLFNIADMYWVDENYFSLMEIPILEGTNFNAESNLENQLFVNKAFVDKITPIAGWTDGIVGKSLNISEHGLSTVVGVFANIRLGSIINQEDRPAILFFKRQPQNNIILIKLNEMNSENIQTVTATLENALPTKEIEVNAYKLSMANMYESSRLFRDSVMIGGIVTLLISLIGLMGYVKDEMNRRRSEIAIRKINGGTVLDILTLFLKDIMLIALPAVVFGGIAAYLTAIRWQESFSEKTSLSLVIFVCCGIVVLSIITLVMSLNGYNTANDNPVNSLRNE